MVEESVRAGNLDRISEDHLNIGMCESNMEVLTDRMRTCLSNFEWYKRKPYE